jgi:hypothetical protein
MNQFNVTPKLLAIVGKKKTAKFKRKAPLNIQKSSVSKATIY